MSKKSIVNIHELDEPFVMAPERYDPRRRKHISSKNVYVSDLVNFVKEHVSSERGDSSKQYLVLDTGDACEGIVWPHRGSDILAKVGSPKKVVRTGDVIISRLRPYLRQAAYIDSDLFDVAPPELLVVCSSEFHVLRSCENRSLAFLVPFLLSDPVQEVLFAAQEGGHHPRFNQRTLETLPIPEEIIANREELSSIVEHSVGLARKAFTSIAVLIRMSSNPTSELSSCKINGIFGSPIASTL